MGSIDIRDVPCRSCQGGYNTSHACDNPDYCACDRTGAHTSGDVGADVAFGDPAPVKAHCIHMPNCECMEAARAEALAPIKAALTKFYQDTKGYGLPDLARDVCDAALDPGPR